MRTATRQLRESDPFGPNTMDASDKQINFIVKLCTERGWKMLDLAWNKMEDPTSGSVVEISTLSKRDASRMIKLLLDTPKVNLPSNPATPAPAADLEAGMYMVSLDNGPEMKIYKVQKAVHGSGKMYAKVLVTDVPAIFEDGKVVRPAEAHFDYAPGIVARLRPEHKMTTEQAKAFGCLYGTCCACAKTLTDENSIFNGFGKWCANKYGWTYAKAPKITLK